jgi:small subunit ribosomal protein S16
MALKIRLTRFGAKGHPFYRVVVADSRNARDGKIVEQLGTYDPAEKDAADGLKIDKALALGWIAKGATCTESCRVCLEKAGVLERQNIKRKPKIAKSKKADKPDAK